VSDFNLTLLILAPVAVGMAVIVGWQWISILRKVSERADDHES